MFCQALAGTKNTFLPAEVTVNGVRIKDRRVLLHEKVSIPDAQSFILSVSIQNACERIIYELASRRKRFGRLENKNRF